ncbi:chloride channel protein [Nitrospina watsonii]|uniref:CBS:IMP dehydrogenase/GMP reductase:voltage-gated Cl-channel n=1 Tax=Nitrospina watsonii TaxID=1323948 RepID=A0ABN8W3P1_9BACT|nr:chloride channel protein [Nitrospina watsonii]CAI2718708.1 Putative CBS:IMP dehydrogenase/GMP reductase:voltage-gated Cl-channel [Nitrospina watsonii]
MAAEQTSFIERSRQFFAKEYNLLILAALIGVLAGAASTLFRGMITFFENIFSASGILSGVPDSALPWLLPLLPMLGGLLIGSAWKLIPKMMEENGIYKVTEAMAMRDGKVPRSTILVCATASSITIGSGGSAGRVAPTVQICAGIGSLVGQLFRMSTHRLRVFVGCGAAAGIAASFNAPLAGVIFAMEIILGEYAIQSFSPIVIAAVLGTVTGRALHGNELTFQTPVHEVVSHWEIFFYLLLGVLCGLAAQLFIWTYFKVQKLFEAKQNIPVILKPALGGLLVGILAVAIPQVGGNGFDVLEQALNGELIWGLTLILIFAKTVATATTLGSGGIGGIFSPSLFVGAMTGATFGFAVHDLMPTWTATSETYALVGMGAVASAVVQAPLTAILILFEMTNDYTIILPTMVCCIVAAYTSRRFNKHSLYVQALLDKGIDLHQGRLVSVLRTLYVRDVMNKEAVVFQEDTRFHDILDRIAQVRDLHYPVLNTEQQLTGILAFSDIREAVLNHDGTMDKDTLTAKDLATPKPITLVPHNNLNEALEKFAELDVDQIPVVGVSDPNQILGMLNRADVEAVYNREKLIQNMES